MQSMVGVQFSRPPSPSRCIAIGSCQSFAPGFRNPKLGYPSLHFLVYPKFNSFRNLTKLVPVQASLSEYVAEEEPVGLKAVEDSTSSSSTAPRSASQGREAEDEEESVLKSIVNLSLPALGAVLSDPIMSLIDTGCVGQVSSVDLAALGPNTSIFNFIFQLFNFLGSATCNSLAGISMRASSAAERKTQQHQASQLLNHALFLAVTFGVAVCVLMEVLAPRLLLLMGASPEYLKPALVYLRIRALSAPAVLILVVGQGACLGRQDATTPLQVNSMAAAFNFIGDALFTLYLGWGVAGAAWATLISQCVAVVLLVRKLTGKSTQQQQAESEEDLSKALPLKLGWYGLPTLEVLGPFLALAGPLIVRCALSMTMYTLTTKAAAEFGTLSVAAHQVALQVFWTLSYFPESLSIAAQSLVARNVKSNPQRAKKLARMLLGFGTMLGVALMGAVASVHYLGASWLTADPSVQHLVQSVTLQSMLCELLCAVALVVEGTAIAAGDIAYLPKMQVLNLFGVLFALWLTFKNNLGLGGVWWCLVVYFGLRVAYHSCYIAVHWNTHVLGGDLPSSILGEEAQAFLAT